MSVLTQIGTSGIKDDAITTAKIVLVQLEQCSRNW